MNCDRPFCLRSLWFVGVGWFLVALFIGETGLLASLPRFAPQVILVAATFALLASYRFSKSLRAAVDTAEIRCLVALHLARFVGIYFLLLSSRGELNPRFAVPAGWGDIVVATGALLLLARPGPRWLVLLWNTIGLVEILLVVGRATTLRIADPDSLAALIRLPLSFLPTLIVPLLIASHVWIFFKLLRRAPRGNSEAPRQVEMSFSRDELSA